MSLTRWDRIHVPCPNPDTCVEVQETFRSLKRTILAHRNIRSNRMGVTLDVCEAHHVHAVEVWRLIKADPDVGGSCFGIGYYVYPGWTTLAILVIHGGV
jgi:hypothetical protein